MKISVVVTVLNEESSIEGLLTALLNQTKIPEEIIIVDAGSSDKTQEIITSYAVRYKQIKLIVAAKVNRSEGRNRGISQAASQIIVVTDAGCIPEKNWVEKISVPFKDGKIDVVSGWYKPDVNNIFQKSLAVYTCVLPHQFNPKTYLPSSRSIAFRKLIWKKSGGYPEHLNTCEDLVFAKKLQSIGAKFFVAEDALVSWRQQNTFFQAFTQLYNYAKGDGEARYTPHLKRAFLIFLKYVLGILLLFYFPLLLLFIIPQYLAWVIGKGYCFVNHKKAFYYLPVLQVISDFAVMSGSLVGLLGGPNPSGSLVE